MKHFTHFEKDDDPLAAIFRDRGTELKVAPDTTISSQGSPSDTMYRISRGCVRVCAYSKDGDRRILQFLGAGDYLGLEDVTECLTAREAVDMVVLTAVPRFAFEAQLAHRPELQTAVRDSHALQINAHTELFILTAQTSAVERVKLFLMQFAARRSSKGFIALPMCRRDIADHLGLSMETVSRAFSSLKARGDIALKGSNFFRPAAPGVHGVLEQAA